jgi:tetratricopeptide (TPR) repeat protein
MSLRLALVLALLLPLGSLAQGKTLAEEAEEHLDAKRYHRGLVLAQKAHEAQPDDTETNGVLGRALFRLNRFPEAREKLERCMELSPKTWGKYCRSYLARIAFYYGEDDTVKELVAGLKADHWVRRTLSRLIAPKGMKKRSTKHYQVYTATAVDAQGGGKLGGQLLELIHKAYSKVFPFKTDKKRVHRVYLLASQQDLSRFATFVWQKGPVSSTGLFYGDQGALLLRTGLFAKEGAKQGFSEAGIRTLFHEAFHQFIDMHAPDVPDWLNEGLAEYFETARQSSAKKLDIGIPHPSRCRALRRNFGQGSLWKLKDFLKINYDQFHEDSHESLNYSEAWSLIHFFLHGPMKKKGRKLLKTYFTILREGRPWEEAHEETFGTIDLIKLEKAWIEYVNRL